MERASTCVAGWSATNLRWEGVAFETFYRMIIEPSVSPDASITHLVFCGLDGYRSVVSIKDALAQDLLIGERLNGALLDADHGAPVRLVSPNQYGYVSIKHLSRIELHTAEPTGVHASPALRFCSSLIRARGSGTRSGIAISQPGRCGIFTGSSAGPLPSSALGG